MQLSARETCLTSKQRISRAACKASPRARVAQSKDKWTAQSAALNTIATRSIQKSPVAPASRRFGERSISLNRRDAGATSRKSAARPWARSDPPESDSIGQCRNQLLFGAFGNIRCVSLIAPSCWRVIAVTCDRALCSFSCDSPGRASPKGMLGMIGPSMASMTSSSEI